jgi:HD-GYP domain-containing protein (c-di-GMP phosphodiesterase class II)
MKNVIISKTIESWITLPDKPEYDILFSENLTGDLDKTLSEITKIPLKTVIFISHDEYPVINKYLNIVPYSKIYYQLVIIGTEEKLAAQDLKRLYHISEYKITKIAAFEFLFIVNKSFSVIEEFFENETLKNKYMARLLDTHQDQEDLINIGKSLSSEKDPNKLLRLILFLSKKITGADAGSIYLVEEDENSRKRLRFKFSHTFSRDVPLEEFVMDIDKSSIAGYVAVTGEVLNIPDAHKISEFAPYSFNSFFDKTHSYVSRSMLVVPMKNHLDEIIGVIQLINSKEDQLNKGQIDNEAFTIKLITPEDFDKYVVTFDKKYDNLLEAIAGQAAVSIENNKLIKQIQNQFEEFVKASVTAIESRDPATSGHSFRVSEICRHMATAINHSTKSNFENIKFNDNNLRELEFAALLHDFGKVYIDLNIFKKAKKLFPEDLENLQMRLDYLYRYVELFYLNREIEMFDSESNVDIKKIQAAENRKEKKEKLDKIIEIKNKISVLNEPTLMDEDPVATLNSIISDIENIECRDLSGNAIDVITDSNKMNLTIKRGSLNPEERKEIETHVVHTYKFVSKIPWPPEYKNIPEIALRHHEMLDGSGYPDGLKGNDSITIQSRMMAIADIYDALAATDRPYKKAVPLNIVLKILNEEADKGKLDKALVDLFIEEKIYEKIDSEDFK